MSIPKEDWVWMPHPAHFIMSDYCRFTMATKVGDFIISTVGELWSDQAVRRIHAEVRDPEWYNASHRLKGDEFDHAYMQQFGYDDIGFNRKYETMVFKALDMPKDGCKACAYRISVQEQFDANGYNDAGAAYKGHLELCEKYANMTLEEARKQND